MFFQSEEWKVVADDIVRNYVNVRNAVTVYLDDDVYKVPIVVPIQLFKFMKEVLRVAQDEKCALYLDKAGSKYNFGLFHNQAYHDLWCYNSLPGWASREFSIETGS